MIETLSYKDSGVDIDAGNESVKRIKPLARETHNATVLGGIGGFGGMVDLAMILKDYKHPVLVQSIDSVGTKLIVANLAGRHDTIGIDMVAHSCNDILCQGARPISFLDYIAVNKVKPRQIEEIFSGIASACKEASLPVIGGEIAELPGVYVGEEYELVGAVTGVVEKEKIVDGKNILPGDVLLGLRSSGLHTNGYSLARKVLLDSGLYSVGDKVDGLEASLGEELLKPHRNYCSMVLALMEIMEVKGISHITGGGLLDNLPRILPEGVDANIRKGSWDSLPIFEIIRKAGNVPEEDMYRTFNMGIGMVLVVEKEKSGEALGYLNSLGEEAMVVGGIQGQGSQKVRFT